jgi:glucose-1-phosphate cytidylyltransferase
MKAVILAGGLGSRLSEETVVKPKPMVEIGGKPILWHIMKIYSHYGINDFVICLGYKGYLIKEYFANYFLHMSDVTFDMQSNQMQVHHKKVEPWKITLVDTGENTMTGGRLKRVKDYLGDEDFCLTYGDGVGDVNISAVIELHKKEKRLATVTAVMPDGRFGAIEYRDNQVLKFQEKPKGDGGWINGGFFVLSPKVIDYIEDDKTLWERQPMQRLAEEGQMAVYFHEGYWQPMDTLREKQDLEKLWDNKNAPWKLWNE